MGCVIYEMTTLKPPFTGLDMQALYRKVIRGQYQSIPSSFSSELSNAIKSMLQVASSLRPSCEKMLELPFATRNFNANYGGNLEAQGLLDTIRFVPSMKVLSNRLPASNYEKRGRGTSAKLPKGDSLNKENIITSQKVRDSLSSDPDRPLKLRPNIYPRDRVGVRLPLIPVHRPV